MKDILMFGLALVAGYAGVALLPAQEPNPQILDAFKKAPSNGVILVGTKRVTGAPFSALAVTESAQTLADGNRIVHANREKLYRDSQGRERKESEGATFSVLGQQMAAADVVIFDPAANASYSFSLQGITATKKLALIGFEDGLQPAAGRTIPGGARAAVTQQLPPAVIEGLSTQGTRSAVTIPAGQIGNERDILVVDEVWYSPDLHMSLITKHSDPRSGETVLRITNISRSEPDPSLFLIPAGYTVTDQTGGLRIYR
jgi:hypothetical protein